MMASDVKKQHNYQKEMKKSETIALYREAFLEGKDEIDRRKFEEKGEDRQYAAVMAWKRRKALAAAADKNNPGMIAATIKNLRKTLVELPELPPKEAEKLLSLADALRDDIANFELIKKGQLLRKLRSQRSSLDREIEQLENKGVKEC